MASAEGSTTGLAIEVEGVGDKTDITPLTAEDEALLADFFKDVDEAARAGQVDRILSCFKLNPYEHLNLKFDASVEDIKKQYRKVSLMVHPDKNPHPRAKDAFAALGKASEWLLDEDRKRELDAHVNHARELIRKERKKEVKADPALAAQIRLMAANGCLPNYEETESFQQRLKQKVREKLTEIEWRRRKMTLRIKDEEERINIECEKEKSERNAKKREAKAWEERREERVGSWRDFKAGKKVKTTGELKPPKLKEEDSERTFVQRRAGTVIPGAVPGGKKNTFKRGMQN